MPSAAVRPPDPLRRLLRASLPPEDRDALARELDELYRARAAARGRSAANAWYMRQVFGFVSRLGVAGVIGSLGNIDAARRDLAIAFRSLRRAPAFTLAFVLTLSIGVGVLATVYAAARWVLLRPVPGVLDPGGLVTLQLGSTMAPPRISWSISNPDLVTLQERLAVHGALAAVTDADVDIRVGDGEPRRMAGTMVTTNYFSVLGAHLVAGRPFTSGEAIPGALPVAVLSYDLARTVAGDAASAIGRDLRVNGTRVLVIGVASRDFRGDELPGRTDLWLPLSALPLIDPSVESGVTSERGYPIWRRMIARVPAPTTPDAAARLVASSGNAVMEQVRREFRNHSYIPTHFRFAAFAGVGLDPGVRSTVRRTLGLLGGAGVFLLCLAAANLTNLALIRASQRSKTTAIRRALGAGRATLARGVLAEAAVLAAGGSIVALGLAALWSRWFQGRQLSEYGGALAGMHVGVRIALATVGVAMLTSIVAWARPAFARRFSSLEQVMRHVGGRGPGGRRTQSALMGLQVALSLVLIVAAGLLGRTVRNLREVSLGFQPDRLLMFSLDPHLHGVESTALGRLGRELADRLRLEPRIAAAGFISPSPLRSSYVTAALYRGSAPDATPMVGAGFWVTPGLLEVLGVHVIAGDAAWRGDSGSAVISRSAWAKVAPGMSPAAAIGQLIPTRRGGRAPVRVAAVIEDVQLSDILNAPPPLIIRPLAERPPGLSLSGLVATAGRPAALGTEVLRAVAAVAPDLPVFDVRTTRSAVDLQFAERTAMALVATTLGAIGVLLAAIGIYGVLAHVVATRLRDIGIRTALGARPSRILSDVVLGALVPVGTGVLVGLGGAALVSRLLASQLFGLGRFDVPSWWGGVALLLAAAVSACLAPAWRATHVPPAEVLRAE